jgi:ubiquinone/menaquinone biosynthesis C-methylase UbiE
MSPHRDETASSTSETQGWIVALPVGGHEGQAANAGETAGHQCGAIWSKEVPFPGVDAIGVPDYLRNHYWWAYVHPKAVKVFERDWLVNLILWGNYARLRDAALRELGEELPGSTLQVACVYGNLTCRLSDRAAAGRGRIDVVDVLPVQLTNLGRKLPRNAPARLLAMNSTDLNLPGASYDRVLLFFLLHEQPSDYRAQTLSEAYRVVKPGGKIVIVDYALPAWWNPIRYVWGPLLAAVEPFALDLWRRPITDWLPVRPPPERFRREELFGGLYQKLVITR